MTATATTPPCPAYSRLEDAPRQPRTAGRWVVAAVMLVSLLFGGCGGGSAPREQTPDAKSAQFTGQVIGFDSSVPVSSATVRARGAKGLPRTTAPATGSHYAVSASGLGGPYLLVSGLMGTVSTRTGQVNLNELTRLQSALVLGSFPLEAFASFGNDAPGVARVTEANLAAARAQVVAFLQDDLGVRVPDALDDFIHRRFEAVAGDPLYDTLVALNAKVAELGVDAYNARVEALVAQARRCIASRLVLAVGGATVAFCPASQSTTPDAGDATLLTHVFASQSGERLTLRARAGDLVDVRYEPVAGAAFDCSGSACLGIGLGPDAADGTRVITFATATLARPDGATAAFDGTLTAPAPGVVLPTLPCDDNRFFLVLPGNAVVADCVSNSVVDLGLTGTFGTQQGQTDFALYVFANVDGSNGLPASDAPTRVQAVLDGGTLVSVTVTRTDPASGTLDIDYKCRGADCNGVSIGAPVSNNDSGFNATLRRITFDGTRLAPVLADGSLSAQAGASLSGTFTGVFIATAEFGGAPPTLASACAGLSEQVSFAPSNESNIYAICPELAGATAPSANALTLADGGLRLSFPASPLAQPGEPPPQFDVLLVTTRSTGEVLRVRIDPTSPQGSSLGMSFGCDGDCVGVSVSIPDAEGRRVVTFSDAVLSVVEPDGFATDARTAVVTGGFTVPVAEVAGQGKRGLSEVRGPALPPRWRRLPERPPRRRSRA